MTQCRNARRSSVTCDAASYARIPTGDWLIHKNCGVYCEARAARRSVSCSPCGCALRDCGYVSMAVLFLLNWEQGGSQWFFAYPNKTCSLQNVILNFISNLFLNQSPVRHYNYFNIYPNQTKPEANITTQDIKYILSRFDYIAINEPRPNYVFEFFFV